MIEGTGVVTSVYVGEVVADSEERERREGRKGDGVPGMAAYIPRPATNNTSTTESEIQKMGKHARTQTDQASHACDTEVAFRGFKVTWMMGEADPYGQLGFADEMETRKGRRSGKATLGESTEYTHIDPGARLGPGAAAHPKRERQWMLNKATSQQMRVSGFPVA